MTRTILASLLLATALAACGTDSAPPSTVSGPIALPVRLREARTIPQPDGSIRIEAVSARVQPNQPYRYPAFTHCGFTANTFDFDGSFWTIVDGPPELRAAARGGNPPAGIDNPTDNGLIVLVGPDRAAWTSRAGIRLELARAGDDVQVFGCD